MSKDQISQEEVLKIADKAKLKLNNDEVVKYQQEMVDILKFINKISEVDTEGIEPTYQVNQTENIMREDVTRQSTTKIQNKIIDNFPDKVSRLLKIPPVLQ